MEVNIAEPLEVFGMRDVDRRVRIELNVLLLLSLVAKDLW